MKFNSKRISRDSFFLNLNKNFDLKKTENAVLVWFDRGEDKNTQRVVVKKKTDWEKIDRYARCDVWRREVVVVGDSERAYTWVEN